MGHYLLDTQYFLMKTQNYPNYLFGNPVYTAGYPNSKFDIRWIPSPESDPYFPSTFSADVSKVNVLLGEETFGQQSSTYKVFNPVKTRREGGGESTSPFALL